MDYLKDNDIYNVLEVNHMMSDEEFYAKTQSYIYFTLLELLGIIQEGRDYLIPPVTEDSPYLETWQFFDYIYHDPRISVSQEADKLMALYRKYHDIMGGIHLDWLDKLHSRFQGRMGLSLDQIYVIIRELRDVFTKRS